MTPLKAIRAKCLDCCYGQAYEVRMCVLKDCPLYPFRFGKNPNRKREYTEEERMAMTAHLRNARLSQKSPV